MQHHYYQPVESGAAWDCNPSFQPIDESYDLDLDDQDDTGDWQVLCLDRYGDRSVNPMVERLSLSQESRPADWI